MKMNIKKETQGLILSSGIMKKLYVKDAMHVATTKKKPMKRDK